MVTCDKLMIRYSAFAIIASFTNLMAQRIILYMSDTYIFFIMAVAFGTFIGLLVKYVLDKYWIFYDMSKGVKAHSKKFMLYSIMGLMTTAIFWGFETIFWLIWKTDLIREVGAIIGLFIGYIIKFKLDKRYVFNSYQEAGEVK